MKKLLKIIIVCLLFVPSYLSADEKKPSLQNIYKLLQEKKFEEGIKTLQVLSGENDINAQLLYSKILFSGDLTPQDFENSYFWGFSALLGGLKKASNILEKLSEYLTEEQIRDITSKLIEFLEKRAYEKDELYNLIEDPGEINNVIDDQQYGSELRILKDKMLSWYQETCDVVPLKEDKRNF